MPDVQHERSKWLPAHGYEAAPSLFIHLQLLFCLQSF